MATEADVNTGSSDAKNKNLNGEAEKTSTELSITANEGDVHVGSAPARGSLNCFDSLSYLQIQIQDHELELTYTCTCLGIQHTA